MVARRRGSAPHHPLRAMDGVASAAAGEAMFSGFRHLELPHAGGGPLHASTLYARTSDGEGRPGGPMNAG